MAEVAVRLAARWDAARAGGERVAPEGERL